MTNKKMSFWESAEQASKEVESYPQWKKDGCAIQRPKEITPKSAVKQFREMMYGNKRYNPLAIDDDWCGGIRKKVMKFEPLGNRVLIAVHKAEQFSPAGLTIPSSAQEKPNQGIVVAIGDEVEKISVEDEVLFAKYSGDLITIEGRELALVHLEHVLGIFKN